MDGSQHSIRLACYLDIARHKLVVHICHTTEGPSFVIVGTGFGIAAIDSLG